jgi:hypothetical protein
MSFASDLFSGLSGFRDHLVQTVEAEAKPALAAVEAHLARLEPLVRSNILAAEDEGKAILHELYGSLVKEVQAEVASPIDTTADAPAPVAQAPAPVAAPVESAPAAADPTQAPESTEASSAPSSTTSDASSIAATDTPAAQ